VELINETPSLDANLMQSPGLDADAVVVSSAFVWTQSTGGIDPRVEKGAAMPRYVPKPIDTSDVELPAGLEALTERLAENTHDNWALERMSQGWQWGESRDDRVKTHPDLVPYADLSESEKDYDRRTAIETLRAILKLGYRIEPR